MRSTSSQFSSWTSINTSIRLAPTQKFGALAEITSPRQLRRTSSAAARATAGVPLGVVGADNQAAAPRPPGDPSGRIRRVYERLHASARIGQVPQLGEAGEARPRLWPVFKRLEVEHERLRLAPLVAHAL